MNLGIAFKKDKQEPSTNGSGIIHMDSIRKVYETGKVKVEALKGIDLTINKGEFVAIVGPSGSGKSTLMNLIGCLDTATDGSYELAGELGSDLSRDELAEIARHQMQSIADAQNRNTELEDHGRYLQRTFFEDACGPARQHDSNRRGLADLGSAEISTLDDRLHAQLPKTPRNQLGVL